MTHLHLVGGFLGSGKTTAIVQACKALMAQGRRVGVITNDQGKYLVDTAFFRLGSIPAVEVTGGCFCCNYDDLNIHLDELITIYKPDVIFAESVGSCADLVATVVKPLLALGTANVKPRSFTVFADIRLMRLLLEGEDLPFSENVNYVFEKQIEEAGLLVLNKQDLLPPTKVADLLEAARQRFPDKEIFAQRSLEPEGVIAWLDRLETGQLLIPTPALKIDYQKYGAGEVDLAWLDQVFCLRGPGIRDMMLRWLEKILSTLETDGHPVGHLKIIVRAGDTETKLSFTTPVTEGWQQQVPAGIGEDAEILLNARVLAPADYLQTLVQRALTESTLGTPITVDTKSSQAFHPGFPKPTHRITGQEPT